MASTEVDICNMALGFLGAEPIIALSDSEWCDTHYTAIRDACLEDLNWSFAMKRVVLSSPSTIEPEYGYKYKFLLPTDNIRVVSVNDNKNEWQKEGRYILCDDEKLNVSYVSRVEDVRQMSAGFVVAFAARLASALAIPLTSSATNSTKYMQIYMGYLQQAGVNDSMQGPSKKIRRRVSTARSQL